MGDRYVLSTVTCPVCDFIGNDVPFAPTCELTEWVCPECGHVVNLVEATGISYEDASNADEIVRLCDAIVAGERVRDVRTEMSEALAKLIDIVCLMSTRGAQQSSEALVHARSALKLLEDWLCENCGFFDPEGLPLSSAIGWCSEISLCVLRNFACNFFVRAREVEQ